MTRRRSSIIGALLAAGAWVAPLRAEAQGALRDTTIETVQFDVAWRLYRAGRFAEAAAAFARIAELAPGFASRANAKLMAAQSRLEAGSPGTADEFRWVADSSRMLRAGIDASLAAGTLDEFARRIVAGRQLHTFWAPATLDGRLAMPPAIRSATGIADAKFAGEARRVQPAEVARSLDAIGTAPRDGTLRALIWTPSDAGLDALRISRDSLAFADTRVARDIAIVQSLRDERAGHVAAAAQHTALVATVADSFKVTDRQVAAFADSLAVRDSAIARTIAQYRETLVGKIAAVRSLAAQNRARIEAIAVEAGAAAHGVQGAATEEATAAEYVGAAEAASEALDAGLTRLPIVYQRDSLHRKLERLRASLAEARAEYDSAYRAASLAERNLAEAEDRALAAAQAEQRAAELWRDAISARSAAEGVTILRARADSLRRILDRAAEGGEFGAAASLFFASLDADSARASTAAVQRAGAIGALSEALKRYPASAMRPRAMVELAELATRKADAEYGEAQRANSTVEHPDYTQAMARYDEFLLEYPRDAEADAAAYTLGSLAFLSQQYDEAIRAFERVMAADGSRYRTESYFRHGDARFELASRQSGEARRAMLAQSAQSYERALQLAPPDGDIYFLSLYKLGWSCYAQAERQQSDEYRRAVDIFARLVREVDKLPAERQARLALRQEAVDYLAIAITQLGGADEAVRYLTTIPDSASRLLVLRRVARALRDQGEFANAVIAYRAAIEQAPTDAGTLESRVELLELFQSRMVEPARAQEARLQLAAAVAPASAWSVANPNRAADAAAVRERALRESGSYALTDARKLARSPEGAAAFASAAALFGAYLDSYAMSDSAQRVSALQAEARFGAGEFFGAGVAYSRTAAQWNGDAALAASARRNAVVAFDSALARSGGRDRAAQDSLFAASDRFIALAPDADARGATVAKGRRAAEGQRWDVVAATFEGFNARWTDDAFSPEARKLVGDARYRQGRYSDAQREWLAAQTAAQQKGRKALADSIVNIRLGAATQAADSLARAGEYERAADSVLTAIAGDIGDPARAADALRNAVEVHLMADSLVRIRSDAPASAAARTRAITAIGRLMELFPEYRHTLTYAALRAKLLADVGRPAESVLALQQLAQAYPAWPGRADAMVRTAGLLDSLGRHADAAGAYERFIAAYPKDSRAGAAQRNRLALLEEGGDTLTANAELARICALKPADALAARCADRAGAAAFRDAMTQWDRYVSLKLVIATRANLTRAGVDQASAAKLQLLRSLTAQFGRAIASGSPERVAAGSFQGALAQWEYGVFLRDVQLPAELTAAQTAAAKGGSSATAQVYFDAALKGWQALVDKAAAGKFENEWVEKARAALKGEGIPAREATP